MEGGDWSKAVELAVARMGARGGAEFTLQGLIREELGRIVRETGSQGATPEATLRRELQQLRDRGALEFLGRGQYQLRVSPMLLPRALPSKCVFAVGSRLIDVEEPERFIRLPHQLLDAAARSVGQWIVYRQGSQVESRGYYATAKVEQIVRDPIDPTLYLAIIEPGTYLEFGHDVAIQVENPASITPISDDDFDRILKLGLVDVEELLPREDGNLPVENLVREEQWLGPVERETALVSRTVRDRQFRKRVLEVYDRRCALTGMQLINGGGRVEAQAAHIMSVESGGPDTVTNGIALSGTVHWMFDRGLISLNDVGEILLSPKINDFEGVTKLFHADRRARLPANQALRPHTRFLAWHREYHRFAA